MLTYMVTAWPPVPNRMLVVPVKNVCKLVGAVWVTPGIWSKPMKQVLEFHRRSYDATNQHDMVAVYGFLQ